MNLDRFSDILICVCNIELKAAGIAIAADRNNALFEPQIDVNRKNVPFDEIVRDLYGDGETFNPFIDVALLRFANEKAIFFIRESGFPRVRWSDTFDPSGLGPFRPMGPMIKT